MASVRIDLDTLTERVNRLTGWAYNRTTVSTARASSRGGKGLLRAIQTATAQILAEEAQKAQESPK